jgi:hypothetical protein
MYFIFTMLSRPSFFPDYLLLFRSFLTIAWMALWVSNSETPIPQCIAITYTPGLLFNHTLSISETAFL